MKAAVVTRYGGPEVMEIRDVPLPRLGDGQILVRVRAIGRVFPFEKIVEAHAFLQTRRSSGKVVVLFGT